MALSNMQVFNETYMPATMETLTQMVEQFNAASGGAILLTSEGFEGDFYQESFWSSIHTAQRRVDRYASNDAQASTPLVESLKSSVKIAGGFGPIAFEPSQMSWLQRPTAQAVETISRQFAEALMQDQLNTAIAALVAAIGNQAALVNDVSASANITYSAINKAHSKFGDASGNLVAQVMRGTTYHDLIGQNIANSGQLFQAGNVTIVDILGRPVIVTDAPALFDVTPDPDEIKVLSLVEGAAVVSDTNDIFVNIDTTNGKKRIETTWQCDYTFGLGIKGYTWDVVNGGKSPTDAELATGTNWDKVVTSDKHTAGVLTIGNPAA